MGFVVIKVLHSWYCRKHDWQKDKLTVMDIPSGSSFSLVMVTSLICLLSGILRCCPLWVEYPRTFRRNSCILTFSSWYSSTSSTTLSPTRQAINKDLFLCRLISVLICFHSFSSSGPLTPLAINWICWILHVVYRWVIPLVLMSSWDCANS